MCENSMKKIENYLFQEYDKFCEKCTKKIWAVKNRYLCVYGKGENYEKE